MTATYFVHKGRTVTLDTDFRFKVTGPGFEETSADNYFDSADKARAAIDRDETAAAQASKHKVSLAMITEAGERCVVTGLNRGNRRFLGAPTDATTLFPDVEWIRSVLAERNELRAKVEVLSKRLVGLSLRNGSVGYGKIESENYKRFLEQVETEYGQKLAGAQVAAPSAEG